MLPLYDRETDDINGIWLPLTYIFYNIVFFHVGVWSVQEKDKIFPVAVVRSLPHPDNFYSYRIARIKLLTVIDCNRKFDSSQHWKLVEDSVSPLNQTYFLGGGENTSGHTCTTLLAGRKFG